PGVMDRMSPVNIVPVAVAAIDHHPSAWKSYDRRARDSLSSKPENPVAKEIRSRGSLDASDGDAWMRGETSSDLMRDQMNRVSSREQVLRQRGVRLVHAAVLMESACNQHPRLRAFNHCASLFDDLFGRTRLL